METISRWVFVCGVMLGGGGGTTNLSGSACGVHKAHSARAHVGSLQGANEKLVVSLVDGVAALEGQHIHTLGESGAYVCG